MFELRCNVRGCFLALHQKNGGLSCEKGHHFDRAKEGYYSLLQPQDRKSLRPGDHDDAVLARRRWLDRGHASGLIDCLRPLIAQSLALTDATGSIVDLGCGDGSFPPALFDGQEDRFCGIDLSKRAIKLASRKWPQTTWVWANADRELPMHDASASLVCSLFGRRPIEEIRRILRPEGTCIVALPGEDDLIELRQQTQSVGIRRSRWQKVVSEFEQQDFQLIKHERWSETVEASIEEVHDALAMTYRGARHSQRQRASFDGTTTITLAADILMLRLANTPPS